MKYDKNNNSEKDIRQFHLKRIRVLHLGFEGIGYVDTDGDEEGLYVISDTGIGAQSINFEKIIKEINEKFSEDRIKYKCSYKLLDYNGRLHVPSFSFECLEDSFELFPIY